MNNYKFFHSILFVILLILTFTACSPKHQQSNNSQKTAPTSTTNKEVTNQSKQTTENSSPTSADTSTPESAETDTQEEIVLTYTKTNSGVEVPKSDNGITIVNHDGWTESQMDFQQGYCEQMMAKMDRIDGPEFCRCFLAKVQYYYEPIYIRDAYDDQQTFNKYCFRHAEQYKAEQEAK